MDDIDFLNNISCLVFFNGLFYMFLSMFNRIYIFLALIDFFYSNNFYFII